MLMKDRYVLLNSVHKTYELVIMNTAIV